MDETAKETGLNEKTKKAIVEVISAQPEVEQVILYGSRAKGNFRPGSDIDLAMKGKELSLSDKFAIQNKLDDLMLPYTIDITLHHTINNKDLLEHINRVGVVLFDRRNVEDTL